MIRLHRVGKSYRTRQGRRTVLDGVDLCVAHGDKVGILGRNGAGKSTLIRIVSGAELPTRGQVERSMSVSWPLAFGGAFQSSLTGMDNLRFVCRVYGADIARAADYVREFSELGRYLDEPVRNYSSGMRARLAFALSMAVEFDCFLIDEVVAVGDSRFHARCKRELFETRADRAIILVSHEPAYVREHCTRAAVLQDGCLFNFPDVEQAFDFYGRGGR